VITAALFLVALGGVAQPVLAQKPTDTEQLLRIIEEQQRRLDAQAAQLAEQQKALDALRSEVKAVQARVGASTKQPSTVAAADAASVPRIPDAPKSAAQVAAVPPAEKPSGPSYEGLERAVTAAREDWPGSFGLQGTDTRMKVSGFAELDIIHDTNNVETPTAFVTQAIQTRGRGKNDGQTSFSVQATRVAVETRTPLEGSTPDHPRRVTTFISADFFNDLSSATPDLRLREAYGEATDFLHSGGDLLLGQTWSTYTNLYAVPSTLEFWAPNTIFGSRNPMVRWKMPVGEGLTLKLAAEAANLRNFERDDSGQIDSSDPAISVENRPRWPDGVVALSWERDPFNLSGGFIARDLRARTDDGRVESAFGWGATLQGRIGMPALLKDDFMQFSVAYGQGIDTLGVLVAYQHWWSPKFYSLGTFGWLHQDNQGVQLPTAYKETKYASLNLTWTPDPRWLLGGEVIYGSREDKDGKSGSNVRTVITGRFNF